MNNIEELQIFLKFIETKSKQIHFDLNVLTNELYKILEKFLFNDLNFLKNKINNKNSKSGRNQLNSQNYNSVTNFPSNINNKQDIQFDRDHVKNDDGEILNKIKSKSEIKDQQSKSPNNVCKDNNNNNDIQFDNHIKNDGLFLNQLKTEPENKYNFQSKSPNNVCLNTFIYNLEDLDFHPTQFKFVSNHKSNGHDNLNYQILIQKTDENGNRRRVCKYIKHREDFIQTNLFILNHIYPKFFKELNIDEINFQNKINQLNQKQKYIDTYDNKISK